MEALKLSELKINSNPATSYLIRMKGDSMTEANIPDGCMAVVDRSITEDAAFQVWGVVTTIIVDMRK